MKKIYVLSLLLIFLSSFAFAGTAGTVNLPKTGQTICYDTIGNVIPCAGIGQDGEIQAGVDWLEPRFHDNGDGTVTDNLTGLMWTKNANLPNESLLWQDALFYVDGMNAGIYENFGFHDWRLPNRKELFSLTEHSRYNPALPADHPFTNVQLSDYWSSTTFAYNPLRARLLTVWYGYEGAHYKSDGCYIWPVRGGIITTLIELSSFTATPSYRKINLEWSTASEIDNAGFNLYRAESENGEYMKINDSLIAAEGAPTQGATYQFIDGNVNNRTTYYYKLEDIDLNGTSTMHGPVSASVKRIYSKKGRY